MDPNFRSNSELEWLVDDENDVVVIGLMYRELGMEADGSVYGSLATQLRQEDAPGGAEYRWTAIMAEDHRRQGYFVAT